MYAFIDGAIRRTRTTLLIMFMVVICGLIARTQIPIAADPEVQIPLFVVTVFHEGISPEDAERLLVLPMEVELRSVEGVKELVSYASEGQANLRVEFHPEFDLDQAELDVRQAVDRAKPELPGTAEEPFISEESSTDFPIIQVNLAGDAVPERVLYNEAVELRDDLETIPSVLAVRLQGHREEMLEAVIDPSALEAYAISNEALINTIMRNNRLIPAGSLDTGEGRFSVKVPSVIEEARDIFDLPIRANADTVVTLRDIASVRRTFKDRTGYARVNGNRALSLQVTTRAGANVIDTIEKVKEITARHQPTMPSQVEVSFSQDQGPFAQSQVSELQGNILTALALVMVLVVAAMGIRSGIIVGLGIPVSFLFALSFLYLLGYTFNFMVMFGMLLGLGMLIDGAIVVSEYADRKMAEGFERRSAYAMAAKRMRNPVVASVATTLAAFVPLMFWPGVSGQFMQYLPVTVFTVLTGSLLYALIFGPVLGSLFGKTSQPHDSADNSMQILEAGDPTELKGATGLYARLLHRTTRHAVTTLGAAALLLVSIFVAYGQFGKGTIYLSDSETQFAQLTVRARGNLSADEINRLVTEVEEQVLQVRDIKGLNTYTVTPGGSRGFDQVGLMFIELHEENQRDRSAGAIFQEIRERTDQFAGIAVELMAFEQGPHEGKPIEVQFTAYQRELLDPAVARVRSYMDQLPGLLDIEDTRSLPGIEWTLQVDRAQAALYGADVSQVGIAVQLVTNGVKVGEYRPDKADDAVDIRVRYPLGNRGISTLDDLRVTTNAGLVPISNFVERIPAPNVDTLQRVDGIAVEYIRANVADGVLADNQLQIIGQWLADQPIDPRVEIDFRGTNEDQAESMAFVQVAFSLSLLLMFVLLVTQFNSIYQSTLILLSVVMSTAGVLLGLIVLQAPFSAILSGIGIVALAGIVVNNNIVLIDTYNHIRREHPDLDYIDVIVRTGAQRLRPVLLTTITTIFGLLPLASNFSVDLVNRSIIQGGQMSNFWVPLSQAIVSGLSFATLLTLVVTPAMLAIPVQLQDARRRLAQRIPRGRLALK